MMLLGLLISTPATAGPIRGAETEVVHTAPGRQPERHDVRPDRGDAARTVGSTAFLLGISPTHKRVQRSPLFTRVVPQEEWTTADAADLPTVDDVTTAVAAEALLQRLLTTEAREVELDGALVAVLTTLQEGPDGIFVTVPKGRRRVQHWRLRGTVLRRAG